MTGRHRPTATAPGGDQRPCETEAEAGGADGNAGVERGEAERLEVALEDGVGNRRAGALGGQRREAVADRTDAPRHGRKVYQSDH